MPSPPMLPATWPGSDRACDKWVEDYAVPAVDGLALHHLDRAMAWLGEELDAAEGGQAHATPFAPRCVKDQIEEALFERRRDLFSALSGGNSRATMRSRNACPHRATLRDPRAPHSTVLNTRQLV